MDFIRKTLIRIDNFIKDRKPVELVGIGIVLLLFVASLIATTIDNNHYKHIAYSTHTPVEKINKPTWQTVVNTGNERNTPSNDFETILKDSDQLKSIESDYRLIFFKVGCKTCQKVFPYLQDSINDLRKDQQKTTFWVNVQSEVGQELIKKYGVIKPSTVVYQPKDKNEDPIVTYINPEENIPTTVWFALDPLNV